MICLNNLCERKTQITQVVDSRIDSSNWKLYVSIDSNLVSQQGFVLENSLIFKNIDDTTFVLNSLKNLIFTGQNNGGEVSKTVITYSKEKGPLLDLTNNCLEIDEEYFTKFYFILEE